MGTIAIVFTLLDMLGKGIEYAERIGVILGASDEEMAELREASERRAKAAHTALQDTE